MSAKRIAKKNQNDDFEITKRIGKDLEKNLNGIEKHPKLLAKQILGCPLPRIKYKNVKQKSLLELIDSKTITFISGPAGTGKSYLSIYKALTMLIDPDNSITQILIAKSTLQIKEEEVGFLSGDLSNKMAPALESSMHLFSKLLSTSTLKEMIDKDLIKVVSLAHIRGCEFSNAVLVMEEVQNQSVNFLKTLLSRLGENSKMIISGDLKQNDRFKKSKIQESALCFAVEYLKIIDEIGFFEFDENDIVRHPLIGKILKVFEDSGY